MQRQLFKPLLLHHIQNDQEADTTEDDQPCRRQVQKDVILIGDQVSQPSQNIEARVVKGRYGMEHADSQRTKRRIILYEHDEAQNGSQCFKKQSHEKNRAHKLNDPLEAVHVQRFLGKQPSPDADALSRRQNQANADGCHSQSADLNEHRHHGLPERGKMVRHVNGDQSRYTHRTGRGKQGIHKGNLRIRPDGNGKYKNHSSGQDYKRKAHCNQPAGRLFFQKIYEKHDFVFSSSISSYMILPSKNTAFFSVLFLLDKQFAQKTRTIGRLPMQKRRQISSRTEREKFSHKKKARQ